MQQAKGDEWFQALAEVPPDVDKTCPLQLPKGRRTDSDAGIAAQPRHTACSGLSVC